MRLAFSVDRASQGVPGTAVHEQFLLNQHPGDIFISERVFSPPASFVNTLLPPIALNWSGFLVGAAGVGGNSLLLNQSSLKLRAGEPPGMPFTESTDPAPPIMPGMPAMPGIPATPGTHDHVDAFDMRGFDTTGNQVADERMYFSVNPDQKELNPFYGSAASIYRTNAGSSVPFLFAAAGTMGLDWFGANTDDVDALVVYDQVPAGTLEPGDDYALFSLSPGSKTLEWLSVMMGHDVTAADIFFTDFQGKFATFAADSALGLAGTVLPAGPGSGSGIGSGSGEGSGSDNGSGAASAPLGDMDWNGFVQTADVDDFVARDDPPGRLLLRPSCSGGSGCW